MPITTVIWYKLDRGKVLKQAEACACCHVCFEEKKLNHCLTDLLYFGAPHAGFCTLKEHHSPFLKCQFGNISLQQVSLDVTIWLDTA